jgi:hypothetical protein
MKGQPSARRVYHPAALPERDRPTDQLFVLDGGVTPSGVFVFDAESGAPTSGRRIETCGVPSDEVFVPGR